MPNSLEEEYESFKKPILPAIVIANEKSKEVSWKVKRLMGSSVEMTEQFMLRQQARLQAI
jgi:hypothetical protein